MKSLIAFSFIFVVQLFASSSNAPKGWWQCSFTGQEWQMVPGPNGPKYELVLTGYASDWKKSRGEAYGQAESDCEYYSDGFCQFNSCKQKSK